MSGQLALGRLLASQHRTYTEFRHRPVFAAGTGGGAATGTTGDTNLCLLPDAAFEYHIKGTQTITAPVLAAGGLNWGMDQTTSDGWEISEGITARNPTAVTAGTTSGFVKVKFSLADVSGTSVMCVGFRKAAAYDNTAYTNYTDYSLLNIVAGTVTSATRKASGSPTVTTGAALWADTETHTVAVYLDTAGKSSFKFDGVAPVDTAGTPVLLPGITHTAADVLIPFIFFLQSSDICDTVILQSYEAGHLIEEM